MFSWKTCDRMLRSTPVPPRWLRLWASGTRREPSDRHPARAVRSREAGASVPGSRIDIYV